MYVTVSVHFIFISKLKHLLGKVKKYLGALQSTSKSTEVSTIKFPLLLSEVPSVSEASVSISRKYMC